MLIFIKLLSTAGLQNQSFLEKIVALGILVLLLGILGFAIVFLKKKGMQWNKRKKNKTVSKPINPIKIEESFRNTCKIFLSKRGWHGWLSIFCIGWLFLGLAEPILIFSRAYKITNYISSIQHMDEFYLAGITYIILQCVLIAGLPLIFFVSRGAKFALKAIYVYLTARVILSSFLYLILVFIIYKNVSPMYYQLSFPPYRVLCFLINGLIFDLVFFVVWMLYFTKSKRVTVVFRNYNKRELYRFLQRKRNQKKEIGIFASVLMALFLLNLFFNLLSFLGVNIFSKNTSYAKSLEKTSYKINMKEGMKLTGLGNAISQYRIGNMYFKGEGVLQDYEKALEWYKKSAEQENANAQLELAHMYKAGQGADKNYKKALYWYKKAAEQENTEAQFFIGNMHYYGKGTLQDYKKALEWYKKAAELGNTNAQIELGNMYHNGEGTSQNHKTAFMWHKKSAEKGNVAAQNLLGSMYYHGEGVSQDYKTAFMWYKKLAEQGDACGQLKVGDMYYNGEGILQSRREAFYWYKKSADQGCSGGQNKLGNMYYNGEGTSQNYKTAFMWYKKSAENGTSYDQLRIGDMYHGGVGTLRNDKKAFYWYMKSATTEKLETSKPGLQLAKISHLNVDIDTMEGYRQASKWYKKLSKEDHFGLAENAQQILQTYKSPFYLYSKLAEKSKNAGVQFELGYLYFNGVSGKSQDYKQAFKWYIKSAKNGNPAAQCNIGEMYYHGKGTVQDYKQALNWYKKSAEQGNVVAQSMLENMY